MAYDQAGWHSGGDFPTSLPPEAGGTHIALFVCWMMLRGHVGPDQLEERAEILSGLTDRSISPGTWFFRWCDGKFWSADLDEEGNEFAAHYYCEEGKPYKAYLDDYARAFPEFPEMYSVPDTWDSFDRIFPMIEARYRKWRNGRKPFWKRLTE